MSGEERTRTSKDILTEITIIQTEMNLVEDITVAQFDMFISLAKEYNQRLIVEGKLNISDYIENGFETSSFATKQDSVGNYQVNYHTGIDLVGGELKSPFFMTYINGKETGSNTKVFSIIGTNYHMRVKHGDKDSLKKTGDFFKPGDVIMPFPKNNNFDTASTGPHFHIEISDGVNFVNPYTLKTSNKIFKTTLDGGKSWQTVVPNF